MAMNIYRRKIQASFVSFAAVLVVGLGGVLWNAGLWGQTTSGDKLSEPEFFLTAELPSGWRKKATKDGNLFRLVLHNPDGAYIITEIFRSLSIDADTFRNQLIAFLKKEYPRIRFIHENRVLRSYGEKTFWITGFTRDRTHFLQKVVVFHSRRISYSVRFLGPEEGFFRNEAIFDRFLSQMDMLETCEAAGCNERGIVDRPNFNVRIWNIHHISANADGAYLLVYDRDANAIRGLSASLVRMDVSTDGRYWYPTRVRRLRVVRQVGAAIYLAMVMDYSGSMGLDDIRAMKQSVKRIARNMRSGSKMAVIQFAGRAKVVQPFTDDFQKIKEAVKAKDLGFTTALYDGIHLALDQIKEQQARNRNIIPIIICMSDGGDNSSEHTEEQVLESAKAAGIPIIGIGYGYVNEIAMQRLSNSGVYHYASRLNELQDAYRRVTALVENSYIVVYTSERRPVHYLRVTLQSPDRRHRVTRTGRYRPS